jgi:hypothetical protein
MLQADEKRTSGEPRLDLARGHSRRARAYRVKGILALASLIAGLLSAGSGFLLLALVVLPRRIVPRLINSNPNMFTFILGGTCLSLALLAIILALIPLISLPKDSRFRKAKIQSSVGLALGIIIHLVILGCFVLLIFIALSISTGD